MLTSHEGGCEKLHHKDYGWYAGGWRTEVPHGAPMTFDAWLDTAVKRWGDSPALAGWTAVGEPDPATCVDALCHWSNSGCHADSRARAAPVYDDTGARIPNVVLRSRHLQRTQPVGGRCGTAVYEFELVSASPGVRRAG